MAIDSLRIIFICFTVIAFGTVPTFAQMDISGQWAPVMDEDRDEQNFDEESGKGCFRSILSSVEVSPISCSEF